MAKDIQQKLQKRTMAQLLAGLGNAVTDSGTTNETFLNFSGKEGKFFVKEGDKQLEVALGTKLLFNIFEAQHGWTCWKDSKPEAQVFVSVFDPLPSKDSLEDHGPYKGKRDGWSQQMSFMFKEDTGANGRQYRLKLGNTSSLRAAGAFLASIVEKSAMYPFDRFTPVVTIDAEAFYAKDDEGNKQKNYKPLFTIVEMRENPKQVEAPAEETKALAPPADAKADETVAIPSAR